MVLPLCDGLDSERFPGVTLALEVLLLLYVLALWAFRNTSIKKPAGDTQGASLCR